MGAWPGDREECREGQSRGPGRYRKGDLGYLRVVGVAGRDEVRYENIGWRHPGSCHEVEEAQPLRNQLLRCKPPTQKNITNPVSPMHICSCVLILPRVYICSCVLILCAHVCAHPVCPSCVLILCAHPAMQSTHKLHTSRKRNYKSYQVGDRPCPPLLTHQIAPNGLPDADCNCILFLFYIKIHSRKKRHCKLHQVGNRPCPPLLTRLTVRITAYVIHIALISRNTNCMHGKT